MSTFQPIRFSWLSASFDNFVQDDPELAVAYDYPDYPSEQSGEGNWIDLYLDATDEQPVGRLWINPDTENIGLEPLKGGNTDYLTKIALELREFNFNGVSALQAYDFIRQQYYAGVTETGELSESILQTMNPDEANV